MVIEETPSKEFSSSHSTNKKSSSDPYTKMLKKQIKKEFSDNFFPYRVSDIMRVLQAVRDVFEKELALAEIKLPVVVVGDIHGQYPDLLRMFNFFNSDKKNGMALEKFVFLGDYVDRGKQSLECIMLVFLLKIKYPNQYVLLRGNHECRAINKVYGFYAELAERFNQEEAIRLWAAFNEVFSYMPVACLVAGNILCMHGGISPHLKSIDDIRGIDKPLADPVDCPLAMDLLWSDPMIGLKGYEPNKVRGVSVHFGEDMVLETLSRLNIRMVIRAHQMMLNGFNFFCDRKMITIFTAPSYYPDKANRGAVAVITKKGSVGFKVLVPTPLGRGQKMFRGNHDVANEEDLGYIQYKKADHPA